MYLPEHVIVTNLLITCHHRGFGDKFFGDICHQKTHILSQNQELFNRLVTLKLLVTTYPQI